MSENTTPVKPSRAEGTVRRFLSSLRDGRVLDALDSFALDGSILEATGSRRRGIREIAAFLHLYRDPSPVEVLDLVSEGERVTAEFRAPNPRGTLRKYRADFEVEGDKIRSVEMAYA